MAEMKDPWKAEFKPGERRFVGSAIKTFILARYLRDVEESKRTLAEQLAVSDTARTLNSPVFLNLNGTTTATSVLEAMITHSDNTATDIAMAAVGADRVRALIAEAGLRQTQIPDSTRKMFCYLAGLAAGQDAGWPKVKDLVEHPPNPRPALNDVMTMASTAEDMVSWYRQSLRSGYFKTRAMTDEFARIQAMATALPQVVPPYIVAYGKGGSIDWQNFHCLSLPGDMVVGTHARHVLLHDQLERAGQRRARHDEAVRGGRRPRARGVGQGCADRGGVDRGGSDRHHRHPVRTERARRSGGTFLVGIDKRKVSPLGPAGLGRDDGEIKRGKQT